MKSGHNQHHHHQRNVEGLVGPGDIQFGSSPPNYAEEGMMQNSLPESTGSIPVSSDQNKQVQRPLQLPVRPQQPQLWSQVSQPVPLNQQQRTPSQEKTTLLEQAHFMAGSTQKAPETEGFKTPDKFNDRRNIRAQSQRSPPRLASPTENRTQLPMTSPTGRKFQRSGS